MILFLSDHNCISYKRLADNIQKEELEMACDYAKLPKEQLNRVKELEEQLKVVLIAYDSKYKD